MARLEPSAVISECGFYRYRLERPTPNRGSVGSHAPGSLAAFIMVNPSTADATVDDPTIRKVVGFADRWGFDRVAVGNLFAWRATDVRDLRAARDPVGPDNDRHIAEIMRDANAVIVAWGSTMKLPEALRKRWQAVVKIADEQRHTLQCIGVVNDGHPLHPLMPGYASALTAWNAPWFAGRTALASNTAREEM